MTNLSRPALRYHGGKWMLAPWLIQHFPEHRTYTEVYGGAASVLLRKPRAYAEVYNDLDDGLVSLFRSLQCPQQAARLRELLLLTPFARREFELAYEPTDDPVEMARRIIIRSFMGFGSDAHNVEIRTGFRADSNKSGTTPAHDWVNYPDVIPFFTARLAGVVIEHRPALQVLRKADRADALHYLDPPYMPETRSLKSRKRDVRYHVYNHEMSVDDHVEMLEAVPGLVGMTIISGYPTPLYDEKLRGWGPGRAARAGRRGEAAHRGDMDQPAMRRGSRRAQCRCLLSAFPGISMIQPFLSLGETWVEVLDGNDTARDVFDRHYSRRQASLSRQFVGPGQKLVLMTPCARAIFAWRKFISDSGETGVNCAIFRNEGAGLSSDLVRAADAIADERWPGERHYTYVDPRRVRSTNPGCCFLVAGWRRCGVTKKRKLLILERPAV
jgi:DNA adenine methylase